MKEKKKYIKKWIEKADKDLKVSKLILDSQPQFTGCHSPGKTF